ncbi:MAG: ATP-binding protein [Flavobacteriales bacterium]|nr:ATP-binding protein [Flavobacteriales bacterium]
MKSERIQDLLQLGEGSRVEFKSGLRNLEAIGKVVCAFLNGGRYVICGITDEGKVTGVDATQKDLEVFERRLNESIAPKALVAVELMKLDRKSVVLVEVAQGRDVPYSYSNVIYVRRGAGVYVADSATIRDMVLRARIEPERWERRFSWADVDRDLDLGYAWLAQRFLFG